MDLKREKSCVKQNNRVGKGKGKEKESELRRYIYPNDKNEGLTKGWTKGGEVLFLG